MQASTTRRNLDSFPPFRADEMVETSFRDREGKTTYAYYPTLGGRLRVGREKHPDLDITTSIVEAMLRTSAIVMARAEATIGVQLADGSKVERRCGGSGIGTADKAGDGRLEDSLIELAESRAVSRALRTLGIGTEYTGAEEMQRAGIQAQHQPYGTEFPSRKPDAPVPTQPATPPAPTTSTVTSPAQAARAELGNVIMQHVGGDRAKAAAVLAAIIPGKASPSLLTEHEVDLARLVVEAAVVCDSPFAVAATKAALQSRIKAVTPVEQWTPAHIVAARDAIRGAPAAPPAAAAPAAPGTTFPTPGHSAAGPNPCPF